MKEFTSPFINTVDHYLQKKDTALANSLNKVFPAKGEVYIQSRTRNIVQRAIAAPLAIVATPIIGVAALAVYLEDHKSPFYKQQRVAPNGKDLNVFKIRSMKDEAAADMLVDLDALNNGDYGRDKDPRVTKVGQFLRNYNLDELPQLWQVVAGQLSLVGQRPIPLHVFIHIREHLESLEPKMREGERPEAYEERKEKKRQTMLFVYERWAYAYIMSELGIVNMNTLMSDTPEDQTKRRGPDEKYAREASVSTDMYLVWRAAATPADRVVTKAKNFFRKQKKELDVNDKIITLPTDDTDPDEEVA